MSVDDSRSNGASNGAANEASSEHTARAADLPKAIVRSGQSRGIVIDPRVIAVGGGVALVGVAVLAVFLWMVPTAAARELQAACRGLRVADQLNPALCPGGRPCSLPVAAPDFVAKDVTGKDVKLSDYRGKVVLLNFWASWCNLCAIEKPGLNQMASNMAGDDFVVLTLASDPEWTLPLNAVLKSLAPANMVKGEPTMESIATAFRAGLPNGTPFKVLLDPPAGDSTIGAIAASWGIKAVPESALIDRHGNLRAYFVNKRDWQSPVAQTCLRSVIDGE